MVSSNAVPYSFDSPDIKMKLNILHAVDRSLEKITVAEICKNAGISRQTFYRHFESKFDIPWWYTIYARQFYLDEIGRSIDWGMGYYQHLRLICKELEFFQKSLQFSINSPYGRTILPVHRQQILFKTLTEYRKIKLDNNMVFLVEHYSKLENEVINEWLRSGSEPDLKCWTEDLVSLVPRRLYIALSMRDDLPTGKSTINAWNVKGK